MWSNECNLSNPWLIMWVMCQIHYLIWLTICNTTKLSTIIVAKFTIGARGLYDCYISLSNQPSRSVHNGPETCWAYWAIAKSWERRGDGMGWDDKTVCILIQVTSGLWPPIIAKDGRLRITIKQLGGPWGTPGDSGELFEIVEGLDYKGGV